MMPVPDLDADGYLPPGLHDCTLEEIKERFGRFSSTEQRPKLFRELEALLKEIRSSGVIVEVIVDGSFVTGRHDPSDIDLALALAEEHDYAAELSPMAYNVVSSRRVRKRHRFDVLVAPHGSQAHREHCAYFQNVKGMPHRKKGILRVML